MIDSDVLRLLGSIESSVRSLEKWQKAQNGKLDRVEKQAHNLELKYNRIYANCPYKDSIQYVIDFVKKRRAIKAYIIGAIAILSLIAGIISGLISVIFQIV